jgi:hypothetical protein
MAVRTSQILSHLPRLRQFLTGAPKALNVESSSGVDDLEMILGRVLGTTKAIGLWQWISQTFFRLGSRKTRVRSIVRRECEPIIKLLTKAAIPKAEPQLQSEVNEEPEAGTKGKKKPRLNKEKSPREHIKGIEKETKKRLKELRKERPDLHRVGRVHELAEIHLARLADIPEAHFLNVNELGGVLRSRAMTRDEVAQQRAWHTELWEKRDADVIWSASMIRDMRMQVDDTEEQVADLVDEERGDTADNDGGERAEESRGEMVDEHSGEAIEPGLQHVDEEMTRADEDSVGSADHTDDELDEEYNTQEKKECEA